MKAHALKTIAFSFIVASALMAPIVAGAREDRSPAPVAAAGKSVTGKVSEKTDTALIVEVTTCTVNETTTFTKAGMPIKLDDIKVGDLVRVTVSDEAGSSRATAVEVMSGGK